MQLIFEWLATIFGIAGALTLAANCKFSPLGWPLFLVSNFGMIGFAICIDSPRILVCNLTFMGTSIFGIYQCRMSIPSALNDLKSLFAQIWANRHK
jgi:hypothetical protein